MYNSDDDEEPGPSSSPPCFMHEVEPNCVAIGETGHSPVNLAEWRKAKRSQLIEQRLAIPSRLRRKHDARISEFLASALGQVQGLIISMYWPFRGEPDLRSVLRRMRSQGACCALPVVIGRHEPLVFRSWEPGDPLTRGVWNIPIPSVDAPVVTPDIIIAPLVGYDRAGFRLGYGGGYYDRTLANLPNRKQVIGVGYSIGVMPTICPQWHDVPMDTLISEEGLVTPAPEVN